MKTQSFQFGIWRVNPADNSVDDGSQTRQMEPRAMDVLVALCREPGAIVSAEQLLEQCWGSTLYGDNPVHKIITQLRKVLGDQSTAPEYIETIRKRGYRTLANVRYDLPEAVSTRAWLDDSPFRGLQAFDEKHAAIFFGRSDAIFRLTELIKQQSHHATSVELLLILGPSGSGKTSLVRAGLLPALMRADSVLPLVSYSAFDLAEKGEHSLVTTLAGMLLDLEVAGQPVFQNYSGETLGQILLQQIDTAIELLHASLATLPDAALCRHVLFIDRFEAIFDRKRIPDGERESFLKILDKLARSHAVWILLTCRNDFYPHIAAYPLLMEGKVRGTHFDLGPPTQAEIAQMIRLPAVAARLSFGVDPRSKVRLDDVLVQSATGNPDALPLLQYALQELYRLRSDEGELGFAAFDQLGGMEGAVGQRAEQVIGALSGAQQACLSQVLSLVTTVSATDAPVTSRRASWAMLVNDDQRAVVNALVESRLFVSELVDGAPGFGVAHEALLRRWPRVVEWLRTHRNALQIRSRVGELASRWQNAGNSQDMLLPEGTQLEEARSLLHLATFSLSPQELALIEASSRRVRWRRRLRGTALGTIIVLALLAGGLGLSAVSAKRQAQERRVEVEGLMGYMLGDFADKLRPVGKLDLLDSVGARALDYFAKTREEELSQTALTQRAKALQVLAEVRIARGDPKSAYEALGAGKQILLTQLAKMPNDREVLKSLGVNAFWLAQTHFNKNEWDQAGRFYRQYQEYSDHLYKIEPDNVEWWIEKSYAHNNLGTVALRQRNFHQADLEFQASLMLKQRALGKKPQDNILRGDLADSLSWLGSVKESLGELDVARRLYQQEAEIVETLHRAAPVDGLWISKWATSLRHIAALQLAIGKKQEGIHNYQQAVDLYKGLNRQEPSNHTLLHNLISTQLDYLFSSASDDNLISTHMEYLKIEEMAGQLVRKDPNNSTWKRTNGLLQIRFAENLLKQKNVAGAEKKLQEGQQLLEALINSKLQNTLTKFWLVDALLLRANLERERGNKIAARQACERGRNLIENEIRNSMDYRFLVRWYRLYRCLDNPGAVLIEVKKLEKIGYREEKYLQFLN